LFQIDGEKTFSLDLTHLRQLARFYTNHHLEVEANVTESLTHSTLNGSAKVQFYDHAEKIEFLASNPSTFKPGLPYTAYVRNMFKKLYTFFVSFILNVCYKSAHICVIMSPPYLGRHIVLPFSARPSVCLSGCHTVVRTLTRHPFNVGTSNCIYRHFMGQG
jgi:hypothetical protein